ncbi:hypothetical protein VCV18_011384 [Metarhizium anisopliae]
MTHAGRRGKIIPRSAVETGCERFIPSPRTTKRWIREVISRPTVLLPTQENVMALIDNLRSSPVLETKTLQQLKWAKARLHNVGKQYSTRSHLQTKRIASAELGDQSPSLLQQFLSQTEPPERFVNTEDVTDPETDTEDSDADEDGAGPESDRPEWSDEQLPSFF